MKNILLLIFIAVSVELTFSQPSPPTLSSPVNNATGVGVEPTLTWTSVPGATSYDLYVEDISSLNTNIKVAELNTSNTSKTIYGLIHNRKYSWTVRAIDGSGAGIYQTSVTFITKKAETTNSNHASYTDVGIWYEHYPQSKQEFEMLQSNNTFDDPIWHIMDPVEIEYHLDEIAEAKIDFIIFDNTNGGYDVDANRATTDYNSVDHTMDNYIAVSKFVTTQLKNWNDVSSWKIKYVHAIGVWKSGGKYLNNTSPGASFDDCINSQAEVVWNDFIRNQTYGGNDASFHLEGKPLLILYMSTDPFDEILSNWYAYTQKPSYATSFSKKFTIRFAGQGAKGQYGWAPNAGKAAPFDPITLNQLDPSTLGTVPDEEVELVSPGHWAVTTPGWPKDCEVARNKGQFYKQNWDRVFSNPLPKIVSIVAFNDYTERQAVFPGKGLPSCVSGVDCEWLDQNNMVNSNMYWDMTKNYINILRSYPIKNTPPDPNLITNGDVNGDRISDLIYFSPEGVYVSTAKNGGGKYNPWVKWIDNFREDQGWSMENTPMMVGDVTGDGLVDIIGFGGSEILVGISNGTNFIPQIWGGYFGYNDGWRVETTPRLIGDITGDGKDDIVGFYNNQIHTGISDGSSFTFQSTINTFFTADEWHVETMLIRLGDVNGDGKKDIIGFNGDGVRIGFPQERYIPFVGTFYIVSTENWSSDFGSNNGWLNETTERLIGDVNGDGIDDIVGFGGAGVTVGISTGSGFSSQWWSDQFGYNDGWHKESTLRLVADVTGDGLDDIIGFGGAGVTLGKSTGGSFVSNWWINGAYGYNQEAGGWRVDEHPRMLGFADYGINTDIIAINASGQTQVLSSKSNQRIFGISRKGTFDTHTEMHIMNNFSEFQSFDLQIETNLHATDSYMNFAMADYNNDGILDMFALKNTYCGSGSFEIHVFNGADNFQTPLLQTGTTHPEIADHQYWDQNVGDYNNDGFVDIWLFRKFSNNTSINFVEVEILNGADNYQSYLLTATPLSFIKLHNYDDFTFMIGNYNSDHLLDIIAVDRDYNNHTSVYVFDGSLMFLGTGINESRPVKKQTILGATNELWDFKLADYNGDGVKDLYGISRRGTHDRKTEIHILNGSDDYQSWLLQKETILGATTSSWSFK
ncbi:MAG: VCBS repeat-containing protein [Fibrobacteria bacterium]|nr:VCBS repeat-containing protein [Fibrobacteria bacterium]